MGDWLDDAKAISELERERSIASHLARLRPTGPSRIHCLDCEEPIPEQRRAAPGILRCTPCESFAEKGQRR
ncbi:TraR/DksA C4-type zinc finger protein [Pseudomonas fluorescens]|uniref:TraR/DksA C4-type zinc finger protein n=1 Tax=Pseudomonas fluorescens TaxID=294 RepID=UPI000F4A0E61|nr:TraR/DksA C4-type zinc finger protein [Pseudomonas fluorescens]